MRRLTVTRASSFLGGEASAGRPAGRRCCLRTVVAPRGAARNRGKPPSGRGRIPQGILAAEGRATGGWRAGSARGGGGGRRAPGGGHGAQDRRPAAGGDAGRGA